MNVASLWKSLVWEPGTNGLRAHDLPQGCGPSRRSHRTRAKGYAESTATADADAADPAGAETEESKSKQWLSAQRGL